MDNRLLGRDQHLFGDMRVLGSWTGRLARAQARPDYGGGRRNYAARYRYSGSPGPPDKPCRLDGNGQQIRTQSDWKGWIKIKHCEFRGLGSASKPVLELTTREAGDQIVIEDSEFHACGAVHLANEGSSGTIFRGHTIHATALTPVTNLPSDSPPGFRASGESAARKLFQGNLITKSIVHR